MHLFVCTCHTQCMQMCECEGPPEQEAGPLSGHGCTDTHRPAMLCPQHMVSGACAACETSMQYAHQHGWPCACPSDAGRPEYVLFLTLWLHGRWLQTGTLVVASGWGGGGEHH